MTWSSCGDAVIHWRVTLSSTIVVKVRSARFDPHDSQPSRVVTQTAQTTAAGFGRSRSAAPCSVAAASERGCGNMGKPGPTYGHAFVPPIHITNRASLRGLYVRFHHHRRCQSSSSHDVPSALQCDACLPRATPCCASRSRGVRPRSRTNTCPRSRSCSAGQ